VFYCQNTGRKAACSALLKSRFDQPRAHMGEGDIERKLQGRTLQVYLYLLKKGESGGIREIQRDLHLSSPSVADYQVEKLIGMGLAAKNSYGRVYITRRVKIGTLESYVSFGRFSIPRLAFYACIFSIVAALYVILNRSSWSIYGIAVPTAAAAVLWIEAWKMWKLCQHERTDKAKSKNLKANIIFPFVPSAIAIVVFATGLAFVFHYVQEPLVAQARNYNLPETGGTTQQQTIEESVTISAEKVALAEKSTFMIYPEATVLALPLAGIIVIGFVGYLLVMYRYKGSVLTLKQLPLHLSGTQDYPEHR
jgi:hypothetical protein